MLTKIELISYIRPHADAFSLDPKLVYGIAMKESGGDQRAVRYEPNYRWLYQPEKTRYMSCSMETEIMMQKTSYGLMQVMGAVFREYGFRGWLTDVVCDIDTQLSYGCRHLATYLRRYPVEQAISAYNAGHPVTWNKDYVRQVLIFARNNGCSELCAQK